MLFVCGPRFGKQKPNLGSGSLPEVHPSNACIAPWQGSKLFGGLGQGRVGTRAIAWHICVAWMSLVFFRIGPEGLKSIRWDIFTLGVNESFAFSNNRKKPIAIIFVTVLFVCLFEESINHPWVIKNVFAFFDTKVQQGVGTRLDWITTLWSLPSLSIWIPDPIG